MPKGASGQIEQSEGGSLRWNNEILRHLYWTLQHALKKGNKEKWGRNLFLVFRGGLSRDFNFQRFYQKFEIYQSSLKRRVRKRE